MKPIPKPNRKKQLLGSFLEKAKGLKDNYGKKPMKRLGR